VSDAGFEPFRRDIGKLLRRLYRLSTYHRMKTVEVHNAFGIGSLRMTDRRQPQPGPDEVLVKINSVSLN
jgi:hypothetical protein